MNNCGFSEEKAKSIEAAYHDLYKESDAWLADKLEQVTKDGYAALAFGLRLRAPILSKSILGLKVTPKQAAQESRTLGNAIGGQSYGLLNNRALNAFMKLVWDSPYVYQIMPAALIHDACYFRSIQDVTVIKYINDNFIKEMEWQELPEIQHPEVKLGAELDLYYPSWNTPLTLSNNISEDEIINLCQNHIKE